MGEVLGERMVVGGDLVECWSGERRRVLNSYNQTEPYVAHGSMISSESNGIAHREVNRAVNITL